MPTRVPTHRPLAAYVARRKKDQEPESARFYRSKAWLDTRAAKLRTDPFCEEHLAKGEKVWATLVHHVKEYLECPELGLEWSNLKSSCSSCHSRHHAARTFGS